MAITANASMSAEEKNRLLQGPALDPPANVTPNFDNPGGNHGVGYGIVILGAVLATIAVLMRIVTRWAIKKVYISDFLLFSAYGLFSGYLYIIYDLSIYPGLFTHQWNVRLSYMSHFLYHVHIGSMIYAMTIMCLKITILLDWLRLFVPTGQRNVFFWTSHGLIWATIIFYVSGIFLEMFACKPLQMIWEPLFVGGRCTVDLDASNASTAIFNLISDVIILALPQWVIWHLNMSREKKMGISLLFAIGIFACVCGIVRMVYLAQMITNDDELYIVSHYVLWDIAEQSAVFLIVGIPSIPKALQSIPATESVITLIRSLVRSEGSSNTPRQQTWPRPFSRKRRSLWRITELEETHNMATLKSKHSTDENSESGATREIALQVGGSVGSSVGGSSRDANHAV